MHKEDDLYGLKQATLMLFPVDLQYVEFRKGFEKDLSSAIYSFNEMGCWINPDIELDSDIVLQAWALVEKLRLTHFPEELRM